MWKMTFPHWALKEDTRSSWVSRLPSLWLEWDSLQRGSHECVCVCVYCVCVCVYGLPRLTGPGSVNRKLECGVRDLHADSQPRSLLFSGTLPQVDSVDVQSSGVFLSFLVAVLILFWLCLLVSLDVVILSVHFVIDVFYSFGVGVRDGGFSFWKAAAARNETRYKTLFAFYVKDKYENCTWRPVCTM